jgi:hypothetical protein
MAVDAILVLGGGFLVGREMWTCKILDFDSRFFSFLLPGNVLCFSLGRDEYDDRRSTWMPALSVQRREGMFALQACGSQPAGADSDR